MSSRRTYSPTNNWYLIGFGLAVLVVLILVFSGLISFTFSTTGDAGIVIVLVGSLLGSFINIPLYKTGGTEVAVNVGGALIPAGMSVFLLAISSTSIILSSLIAVLAVTIVTHLVARPVRGVGIETPSFVPPLAAAVAAVILSPSQPAVIAYVSGTLGTLIGADLLNLGKVPNLGAGVSSIGGAGTFDGVFLTGIVAVILSTL